MKVAPLLLVLVPLVCARPEPPVPGYSTTQQHFMAPSYDAPSATYGAPSDAYSAPSAAYGAPSEAYSAPSATYGAPSGPYRSAASVSTRLRSGSYRMKSGSGRNGVTAAVFRSSGPSSSYGAPAPVYGPPNGGYNYDAARSRLAQDDLSEPANYDFSYAVEDGASGSDFGHQESRQDESAVGEYRVALPDGRTLIVEYEANENGYNPRIRYEEPAGRYAASSRNLGGPY